LTDIRRGIEIPGQSSPLGGSSFKRGLGAINIGVRGLSGFQKQLKSRQDTTFSRHYGCGPQTMALSPFKFLQEVRSETAKVTWPTRRETMITTIMVFIMVAVSSVFFFVADQIIRVLITFLLGIQA
jgi:preprotein translocase subunit SecE